uniref:Multifunctional methyltransferase subunit TRM112-like protein n=1 Tax=Geotrypetes seraphini TaxID=260995 RepID=A0A6P8RWS2_GEOSA|nr:multifunctional methyltransferase subunit TRM112-like protein isoform X2 [Geotrypetes seraphini]
MPKGGWGAERKRVLASCTASRSFYFLLCACARGAGWTFSALRMRFLPFSGRQTRRERRERDTRVLVFVAHVGGRDMKLLTHNLLTSHVKGVVLGYPLIIQANEVKVSNVDFNQAFVARMIPKLEWSALIKAADSVEVMEGTLKCPESGREFPIIRGIPNMLLNEEET